MNDWRQLNQTGIVCGGSPIMFLDDNLFPVAKSLTSLLCSVKYCFRPRWTASGYVLSLDVWRHHSRKCLPILVVLPGRVIHFTYIRRRKQSHFCLRVHDLTRSSLSDFPNRQCRTNPGLAYSVQPDACDARGYVRLFSAPCVSSAFALLNTAFVSHTKDA